MSSPQPPNMDLLQIGDCRVVLSLREIHVPGAKRPRRVTPKAMAVLRLLAETPGQVVTRERILARVWPDTLPTDDVVTQAVTQLRKSFNAGEQGRDYIETIPKGGYRLLAEVAMAPGETPAGTDDARREGERRRLRTGRLAWLAGAGIAAVLGGVMLFGAGPSADGVEEDTVAGEGSLVLASPARPYRFITASPEIKITPTLSPDGSMVAYATVRPGGEGLLTLMVQTTDNAPARVLVEPEPGGSDRLPEWSPDGRRIAFMRQGRDDDCRVMVVPSTGGRPQKVANCEGSELPSFSWTPDGTGLLFGSTDAPGGRLGLRTLDLDTGRWQALEYGPGTRDFDYMPRYSPDGRWIVFARNPQMGQLWKMPAEGGTAEPLLGDIAHLHGWDWWPDGHSVVLGRRVDSEHRLYRVPLDGGMPVDLGIDDAQNPTVAVKAGVLGFVRRESTFGIYRVDLTRTDAVVRQRLFASGRRDSQPMLSPDGTQLLFSSDRSGDLRLWWADLESRDDPKRLDGFQPDTLQPADWAPDGRSALVVGRDRQGAGLFEVHPHGARVARLEVPAEGTPVLAAHAGGAQLLVGTSTGGGIRLTLYDRDVVPWQALGTLDDVSRVRVDHARQRLLFTRLTAEGLWEADFTLSQDSLRRLHASVPRRWFYRSWDVDGDGRVLYVDIDHGCASVLVRLPATAGSRSPDDGRWCLDAIRLGATNGISVARDGTMAYIALAVRDGTEIGLMPLASLAGGAAMH